MFHLFHTRVSKIPIKYIQSPPPLKITGITGQVPTRNFGTSSRIRNYLSSSLRAASSSIASSDKFQPQERNYEEVLHEVLPLRPNLELSRLTSKSQNLQIAGSELMTELKDIQHFTFDLPQVKYLISRLSYEDCLQFGLTYFVGSLCNLTKIPNIPKNNV